MNHVNLTGTEEPTDAQLSLLMKEVAAEATLRAARAQEQLRKKLEEEIQQANEKYKANNK